MKRREFIRNAGALGLLSALSIPGLKAESHNKFTSLIDENSDKILVLIQLFGGNDGLNTVVPLDQYANLDVVRGNILVQENKLLPLTDTLALHPKMPGMQQMFQNGTLSILQNVGYPNHSRSHFRSFDIWNSAEVGTTVEPTGWLGRFLEGEFPGFPTGYPNNGAPHPPAISIGKLTHPSCEGDTVSFGQTVSNQFSASNLSGSDGVALPNNNFGAEMEYLRIVADQTIAYSSAIDDAYNSGQNHGSYPSSNALADQLETVAKLINGGLETKVYTVKLSGFDTHANQTAGDRSTGTHAELLKKVSQAITAFHQDIEAAGNADRVLGLTFSEFGRRIRSNNSRGSDHGAANMMFMFGSCLQQQVLGNNPVIDTQISQGQSLPMEYDFRDIYGSILQDWFAASPARIRQILYPEYTYLPLAGLCGLQLPVDLFDFNVTADVKNAKITWKTAEEIDNSGFEVEVSTDGLRFNFMKWVPSRSQSSRDITSYDALDGPLSVGTTYYYRIKSVALDGTSEYSKIQSVKITGRALEEWSFGSAFPTPSKDRVSLTCYAPVDRSVAYIMFDATGRQVLGDSVTVYGGRENLISISLSRLPPGMYTLRFDTHGLGTFSRRVVIG